MVKFILSIIILNLLSCAFSNSNTSKREINQFVDSYQGIKFECSFEANKKLKNEVITYLQSLEIDESLYFITLRGSALNFTLRTPFSDTNTLNLYKRPEYKIKDEVVNLIAEDKKRNFKKLDVVTVSKKEIALALMQHGRTTVFKDENCSLQALKDHIGVRQNIVAWSERVEYSWPNGGPAKWNKKYWNRGNPILKAPLNVLVHDLVANSPQYSIGCYTATKAIIIQGVLDYYKRVNQNSKILTELENVLLIDQDPLVGIERPHMWSFERDYNPQEINFEGKLLSLISNIPKDNYIPGDWLYILNTDSNTYEKTGYEGSNSVYLGRNFLNDYYNDHNHRFTFEEKLDEVYQWRNHVFSFSRDQALIRPLTYENLMNLFNSPLVGGLVLEIRSTPEIYSIESLQKKSQALKENLNQNITQNK